MKIILTSSIEFWVDRIDRIHVTPFLLSRIWWKITPFGCFYVRAITFFTIPILFYVPRVIFQNKFIARPWAVECTEAPFFPMSCCCAQLSWEFQHLLLSIYRHRGTSSEKNIWFDQNTPSQTKYTIPNTKIHHPKHQKDTVPNIKNTAPTPNAILNSKYQIKQHKCNTNIL